MVSIPEEILHAIDLSKPNIVVCSKSAIERNYSIIKVRSHIKRIIQFDGTPIESSVLSYMKVMVQTDALRFKPVQINGCTSIAFIMNSSGTTGLPKGVMLTHLNLLYIMANLE